MMELCRLELPDSTNAESRMIKGDQDIFGLLLQAFDALAHAESLADYRVVRDTAEAIRVLAKNARAGLHVRNRAAELRLRAERGAGDLLRSMALRGGDRKTNTRQARLSLRDLGITNNESTRWQKLATVPEHEFSNFVIAAQTAGVEITSASLLKLATTLSRKNNKEVGPESEANDSSTVEECDVDSPQEIIAELVTHYQAFDSILAPLYDGARPTGRLGKAQRENLRDVAHKFMALLNRLQQITQGVQEE